MIYGLKTWNQIGDSAILTGAVHNVKTAHPELEFSYVGYARSLWYNNEDVTDASPDEILPLISYGGSEDDERTASRGNTVEANTRTLCELLDIPMVGVVTRTPYLRLSEDEKEISSHWEGKWLLNANCQKMSRSKGYPHWQQVVDGLKDDIRLVQVGSSEKRNLSPDLTGVQDMRGHTEDLRIFMSMVYGCEGIISPPSGIMNIGAAFGKKMVIILGAREPVAVTDYDNVEYITLECCGFGSSRGCFCQTFEQERPCHNSVVRNHIQYSRCMDLIEPDRIIEAVRKIKK